MKRNGHEATDCPPKKSFGHTLFIHVPKVTIVDKVSEDSEGSVLLQLATLWKKLLKIHDYAFLVCGEPSTGLDIGSGLSRVITYKWLGTSGEYIASPPKILRYGKRSADTSAHSTMVSGASRTTSHQRTLDWVSLGACWFVVSKPKVVGSDLSFGALPARGTTLVA